MIVLDLMMPRLDGAGVMKYLGEYHPAQLPTVLVMTAFGASAAERLSRPAGHFLEKPFDMEALVREVGECVKASAHAHAPESAPDS